MDTPDVPAWLAQALRIREDAASMLWIPALTDAERKALTSVVLALKPALSAPCAESTPRAFMQWCDSNQAYFVGLTAGATAVVATTRSALRARSADERSARQAAEAKYGPGCAVAHPSRIGKL